MILRFTILSLTLHFLSGPGIHLSELSAVEWTQIPEENVRAEGSSLLVCFYFCFEQMRKPRPRVGEELALGHTAI